MNVRLALLSLSLGASACTEVIVHDPVDAGAARFVQGRCTRASSTTTTSLSFAAPNEPGDLLVAAIDFASSAQNIVSVSDSSGATWEPAFPIVRSSAGAAQTWFTTSTGGVNTVTVTLDAPTSGLALYLHEYSGDGAPLTFEAAAVATGSGSIARTGEAGAPRAGDLLFAHGAGSSTIVTAAAPLRPRASCNGNLTADGVAGSPGDHEVTFESEAPGEWTATLAIFTRPAVTPHELTVGCSSLASAQPWLAALALTCLRRTRRRCARPALPCPSRRPTPRRSE